MQFLYEPPGWIRLNPRRLLTSYLCWLNDLTGDAVTSQRLIDIFHRLPYRIRVWTAGAYGHWLRWQRYGAGAVARADAAAERESWSPSKWKDWQSERLQQTLTHAATVPWYREWWSRQGRSASAAADRPLREWPVLSRELIQSRWPDFLSQQSHGRVTIRAQTSGTTGTPMPLRFSRNAVQEWYAICESRLRRWNGVSVDTRWANFAARPVVSYAATQPPFWVWNSGLRQLYLSTLHIAPHFLDTFPNALRQHQIRYLYGYTTCLTSLASRMLETNQTVPLQIVVTCGEALSLPQRRRLEQAFACPVRETFGQAEKICAASECEHGTLHEWPDVGFAEVLDQDAHPVKPGETGRLVCTGFLHDVMPLIRYDTGDLVQRQKSEYQPCACGRQLPAFGPIAGRYNDNIVAIDGRRVGQLDSVIGDLPLREAQFVQSADGSVDVRLIPSEIWSDEQSNALLAAMRSRIGDTPSRVTVVDRIERSPSGKLRTIISHVPVERPAFPAD